MQRSETIRLDGATSASVDITMAVGDLHVSGGATELLEADFIYQERLEPFITRSDEHGQELIGIGQHTGANAPAGPNEWNLRFNGNIPISLKSGLSAASATMHLDDMMVRRLELTTAAGALTVHAGGDQPELERVFIESASGRVRLSMTGNYVQASSIAIESAAGGVELDLSGTWGTDVEVTVKAVAGAVRVLLPAGIGALVHTTSMVGKVSVDAPGGFRSTPDGRVNATYGTTPSNIRLSLTTVAGAITVSQAG